MLLFFDISAMKPALKRSREKEKKKTSQTIAQTEGTSGKFDRNLKSQLAKKVLIYNVICSTEIFLSLYKPLFAISQFGKRDI